MSALATDLKFILGNFREADFLGETQANAITAAGTTQGAATALTASINNITTVAAGVNDSARLPVITGSKYAALYVRNSHGADTLNIFPGVGDSINALAANASIALGPGTGNLFLKVTSTKWISFP